MNQTALNNLRLELSIKAKNGIDFILSASFIWFSIAWVWTLPTSSYNKSVLTFIVGGLMLPLALLLSRILKTDWKVKDNPLQPLGLWLNFAQLFYFPFLIFILIKQPESFVMTYAIITGAHFFPYAWFYNEKSYAILAGMISIGSMLLGILLSSRNMFYIPIYTGLALLILSLWNGFSYRQKKKKCKNRKRDFN